MPQPLLASKEVVINSTVLNKDVEMRAPSFRDKRYGSQLYRKTLPARTKRPKKPPKSACSVRVLQYVMNNFVTEFLHNRDDLEGDNGGTMIQGRSTASSAQAGPSGIRGAAALVVPQEVIEISSNSDTMSLVIDLSDS